VRKQPTKPAEVKADTAVAAAPPASRAAILPLVGGALCLDFTNTSSGRGTEMKLEHLQRWPDFLAWAEHAGIIDGPARSLLERRLRGRAGDAELGRILELREAIYGLFLSAVAGRTPPPAALARLNAILAEAMAAAEIRPAGRGFELVWPDLSRDAARLLWPMARSAAELLTGRALGRVKVCPGHGCGWLFLDRSRNGRRRWCEMEVCGSRAKMRRYHARRRADRSIGAR